MNAQNLWWKTAKSACFLGLMLFLTIWREVVLSEQGSWLDIVVWLIVLILASSLFFLAVAKPPVDMEVLDKATREHMEKEVRRIMSENAPEAGTGCSLQCLPRTTIEVVFVIKLIRASDGESEYFFLGFDTDHAPRLFSMNKVEAGIEEAQEMPLPPFKLRIWNDGQQNKASIIKSSSRT